MIRHGWLLLAALLAAVGCDGTLTRKLDPRATYETFDGRFLEQVAARPWEVPQPAAADDGEALNWLPAGETLALLNCTGLIDLPAAEHYLDAIATRLLQQSPVTGIQPRFVIAASGGYGSLQALPDGVIVVPLDFLLDADSDDEVAAMLAHELSHLILGHHGSDWIARLQGNMLGLAEAGMESFHLLAERAQGAGIATASGMPAGYLDSYRKLKLLRGASEQVLLPGWQRRQEDEADLLGLDLLLAAGYSQNGMSDALDALYTWEQSESRREEEVAEARRNAPADRQEQSEFSLFTRFGDALSEGWNQLRTDLARRHHDAERRGEEFVAYFDREYGEHPYTESADEALARLKHSAAMRNAAASYGAAWEAQHALATLRLEEAERDLRRAVSGPHSRDAYPRLVFHALRVTQERPAMALKNLELALTGPRPSYAVYAAYVDGLLAADRPEQAARILEQGWERFEHPPYLYPLRIRLARLSGDEMKAKALMEECGVREYSLKSQCRDALQDG